MWDRPPGFETLVRIILEQQVSIASADAALDRLLRGAAGAVEPSAILAAGESALRDAGLTRQKARYLVASRRTSMDGRLDLEAIEARG